MDTMHLHLIIQQHRCRGLCFQFACLSACLCACRITQKGLPVRAFPWNLAWW